MIKISDGQYAQPHIKPTRVKNNFTAPVDGAVEVIIHSLSSRRAFVSNPPPPSLNLKHQLRESNEKRKRISQLWLSIKIMYTTSIVNNSLELHVCEVFTDILMRGRKPSKTTSVTVSGVNIV